MQNNSLRDGDNTSSTILSPDYCGIPDEVNKHIVFWIEGVLLSVVGLIGIFGNAVTFYVLSKIPSKYNIFNKLLMQLVTGESISIILFMVDFSLRRSFKVFALEDDIYGSIWPKFLYPFIKLSFTWIMFCTIAITIDRFVRL